MKSLLLGLLVFLGGGARAATVSAGLSLADFDYKENSSTANRSTEKGVVPFVNVAASAATPWWNLDAELALRSTINAPTAWDGTDGATLEPASARDVHAIHRLEAALSRDCGGVRIFAGLAWNSWNRFLAYGSGYREIYEWSAVPFGLGADLGETGWRADVAIVPVAAARLKLILSETIKNGDDTLLDLGKTTGFRLKATKDFTAFGQAWSASPWFERSSFGASAKQMNATLGEIHEPDSETTLWGVTLSAAFSL